MRGNRGNPRSADFYLWLRFAASDSFCLSQGVIGKSYRMCVRKKRRVGGCVHALGTQLKECRVLCN